MQSIKDVVDEYLSVFPEERPRLRQLLELIKLNQTESDLFSRSNFVGHITASGFIVSRKTKKILRVYYKALRMHLQPGGHFKPEDTFLLDTAIRQVHELTSLNNLEYLPYHYNVAVPLDIDTHAIPDHTVQREPRHWHHDFRYLFMCDNDEQDLQLDESEVIQPQWDSIIELQRLQTFTFIVGKIQKVLSREFRQKRFYNQLVKNLQTHEPASAIVVAHLLPDIIEYLNALNRVANIVAIIPKPKSIVEKIQETVSSKFNVLCMTRDQIADISITRSLIEKVDGKVVIFDIGGWFVPVIDKLAAEFPGKILGIVEDTENGHQKYEKLNCMPVPIYSVARSPLKDTEDFLVGESVLFSADVILRDCDKLIEYLTCSIFGYGKIGKSIAHHLLTRGIKPNVYDINPLRRLNAYNKFCTIPSKEFIMKNSDVIFCATGSHALDVIDFRQLKEGCFIFSVTSSDDEFDLTYLDSEYEKEEVKDGITKYYNFNNYFYLVNQGNAVNFIHKAVLGDFIHLVRAEMMYAYRSLIVQDACPGMYSMEDAFHREIASIWIGAIVDEL